MKFEALKVGEFFQIEFSQDIYMRIYNVDDCDPWYGTLANAVNLIDGTTENFHFSTKIKKS